MADKYWKTKKGYNACGNYRTFFPFSGSVIRMSNFVMEANHQGRIISPKEKCYTLTGVMVVRNDGMFELNIDSARCNENGEIIKDVLYRDDIRSFLSRIYGYSNEKMSFTGNCYKGKIDGSGERIIVTNTGVGIYLQDILLYNY